ncbi:MAG: hypothetical protein RSC68_01290 [Acinetobacter sp.]
MNKIFSEQYVAIISIFWGVLIAALLILKRHTLTGLALNSIGDFLAGAFAPLGFFWLVAGFYQQGKGLEQNSEALKIQAEELQRSTEALQLQANELANSVQEQKNLIEIHKEMEQAKHFAARPYFEFKTSPFEKEEIVIDEYFNDEGDLLGEVTAEIGHFKLDVKNVGEVARHFSFIDKQTGLDIYSRFEINKNSLESIAIHFDPDELSSLKESYEKVQEFTIIFFDIFGKKFKQKIITVISQDHLSKGKFYIQHQAYKVTSIED